MKIILIFLSVFMIFSFQSAYAKNEVIPLQCFVKFGEDKGSERGFEIKVNYFNGNQGLLEVNIIQIGGFKPLAKFESIIENETYYSGTLTESNYLSDSQPIHGHISFNRYNGTGLLTLDYGNVQTEEMYDCTRLQYSF